MLLQRWIVVVLCLFPLLLLAEPVFQGPVLQGPVLQGPVLQGPVLQGPVLQVRPGKKERPKDPVRECMNQAKELEASGDLRGAEYRYRKLQFLSPQSKKFKKSVRKLVDQRVTGFLETYEAAKGEELYQALTALGAAFRIDPRNKKVLACYAEHGYQFVGGQWLKTDEVLPKVSEQDRERGEALELDETYQVIRRGPLRFYTNMNQRQGKSLLTQVIDGNLTHIRMYRQVMSAFYLNEVDGLDIVFFGSHAEYNKYVNIAGTAGVYIPSKKAGFFFKDSGVNFPTMIHEMTHQHNDKILSIPAHSWFEEGMSEYFASGYLSNKGKRMKLGIPDGSRMMDFQMVVKSKGNGGYIPLERFARMPRAELTGEFYAQAWALAFYLMEIHPQGRLILFDYIAFRTGLAGDLGMQMPSDEYTLINALKRNKITLGAFEQDFLAHYRGQTKKR